jgi:hypothetical protein
MRQWLETHAANDMPLILLMMMLGVSLWMLVCASRTPNGVIGRMLQDEAGKPSVLRLCMLWGFSFATWAVMKDTLRPEGVDRYIFGIYVAGTFGAPVVVKISEKWNGHLPWSKPS